MLTADRWGRPVLVTTSGSHYTLGAPGETGTTHAVDACLRYAARAHPEDVNELLDARLVIEAEEIAA